MLSFTRSTNLSGFAKPAIRSTRIFLVAMTAFVDPIKGSQRSDFWRGGRQDTFPIVTQIVSNTNNDIYPFTFATHAPLRSGTVKAEIIYFTPSRRIGVPSHDKPHFE